jgi:CRP-like cAMP-binding protein
MISPETLRRYPYFSGATEESLDELAMTSEERIVAAGQFLFEDGEVADHLFILTEGEVDIQYRIDENEPHTVDTRIAGDLLVWSALVHPYRTTAFGFARRETKALAIDALKLRELCERDHDLGYHLFREIAEVMSHRLLGARVQLATVP